MAETTDKNKEMQQKMELQLHEQYAQNNNSYFNSIVVLVCTLLAVIGAYGYVFIRTELRFTQYFEEMTTSSGGFTLDALILTAMASLFVLAVCYYICIYQGVAQRNEQFITDAIRRKYYGQNLQTSPKLFPDTYHPYCKYGIDIIQGHYGLFICFLKVIGYLVIFSTATKIVIYAIYCNYNTMLWIMSAAFLVFIIVIRICCYNFYKKQLKKYYQRQCEFFLFFKPDIFEGEQAFTETYCKLCNEIMYKKHHKEMECQIQKWKQQMNDSKICKIINSSNSKHSKKQ